MTPIVRVIGPSGAGKTTTIERLVPLLRARGLQVGTIKHAPHGFDIDKPGSDSDRQVAAGADPVLVVDDHRAAIRTRRGLAPPASADPPGDRLGAIVARWFAESDLVLAEGFTDSAGPAILVRRDGLEHRVVDPATTILGVLTDAPSDPHLDDDRRGSSAWGALADRLEDYARDHRDDHVHLFVDGSPVELAPRVAVGIDTAIRDHLASMPDVPDGRLTIEIRLRAEVALGVRGAGRAAAGHPDAD